MAVTRDAQFVQDMRRCARKLGAVAQACRGPRGRLQLLRGESEGSGAVLLTTVSARLFAPLASHPSRPAVQMLVDAVTRHHAIHGDAGLLMMQMATRYSSPRPNLVCRRTHVSSPTILAIDGSLTASSVGAASWIGAWHSESAGTSLLWVTHSHNPISARCSATPSVLAKPN